MDVNAPVDYHEGTALHWAARTGLEKGYLIPARNGTTLTTRCFDGMDTIRLRNSSRSSGCIHAIFERLVGEYEDPQDLDHALIQQLEVRMKRKSHDS